MTTTTTTTTTTSITRISTVLRLGNDEDQQQQQQHTTFSFSYDGQLSEHSFAQLYSQYLPLWLIEKLKACNWEYPTLIQERALNAMFFGDATNSLSRTIPIPSSSTDSDCRMEDSTTKPNSLPIPTAPTSKIIPNSIVIQAQTGSGKTLTYLLPLLAQLQYRSAIQAMIVVPTRELGLQVAKVAKRLASGAPHKILIMSLLQGSTLKRQRAWAWAETPQVVIGTPRELLNMVQYGGLPRINSIQYVVVDEVDACLVHQSGAVLGGGHNGGDNNYNSGGGGSSDRDNKAMASALHILLSKHLSPTYSVDDGTNLWDDPSMQALTKKPRQFQSRQTVFASATIPQHRHFLKQCQANQWTLEQPLFVCTSPGEVMPPTLQHGYLVCAKMEVKLASLRRLIKKLTGMQSNSNSAKKILIFCDVVRPMEEIGLAIAHDVGGFVYQEGKTVLDGGGSDDGGIYQQKRPIISVLRMEDSLTQRAGATDAFRSESTPLGVLLTGDLAARGLDIPGITHVIHFDLPSDADTYLHRSGRAGRFGSKGQVLSIITPDQEFVLERLANALQLSDRLSCVGRQKTLDNKKRKKKTTEYDLEANKDDNEEDADEE